MSNSIAGASKYVGELDKMIAQVSKTGFLADNVFKAKFVGSKTVFLPEITMTGMGNYSRTGGYPKGDTTLTFKDYTLKQERGRQLFLDAQDEDESGVADLAGKLANEYVRTQVVPEVDAYNISTMFAAANTVSHVKEYAEASAVKDFLAAINSAESAMGYDGSTSLVAFVDPVMYGLLQTSAELERHIVISDFKQGEVNMKVKTLNGCAIIPVSPERMKSAYTFNAGASATAGGFTAASGAKDVRAIVLPKDSASFVKKVDKFDILDPSQVEDFDAYKINFRMYYDLLIKNSRKNTIYAIATA